MPPESKVLLKLYERKGGGMCLKKADSEFFGFYFEANCGIVKKIILKNRSIEHEKVTDYLRRTVQ
jgi:hypothetical protein